MKSLKEKNTLSYDPLWIDVGNENIDPKLLRFFENEIKHSLKMKKFDFE